MHIAPIMSLENRLREYHRRMRDYFLTMLIYSILVFCGCMFVYIYAPEIRQAGLLVLLFIGILFLVPPAVLSLPKKPTRLDVAQDVALRRALGMNSDVEDEAT